MDEQLVRKFTFADYEAAVYSTNFPGEFRIIYLDPAGKPLEEIPLTGISSYRQRETEIVGRLRELHEATQPLNAASTAAGA